MLILNGFNFRWPIKHCSIHRYSIIYVLKVLHESTHQIITNTNSAVS